MTTGKVSPKCALTRILYLLINSGHRSVTKECPNHDGNGVGKSGPTVLPPVIFHDGTKASWRMNSPACFGDITSSR